MNIKNIGLIPLPILLLSLLALGLTFYPEKNLPPTMVFELPSPFSSAHSLFLSVSALVVAYFFTRGFLSGGSFELLALGSASLVLGLGFLLSQILGTAPFGGPNQLTAISSLVFLFAGIFFGAFATTSVFGKAFRFVRPHVALVAGYVGSGVLIVVIIIAVEAGLLPRFFAQGSGPTLLREEVLGTAVVLFSYSSIVLIKKYAVSHTSVLYWFALGLALVAIGFLSALLGKVPGGPFSWLGRISVAMGGIYLIVSILAAFREEGPMNN